MSNLRVSPNNAFSLDALASLPMTRAEEHKRARLKVEVGVPLALEARKRVEEDSVTGDRSEERHLSQRLSL